MKCENENEASKELMNEMQIDDSKVHYAYDPDNDQCKETAYCYSQLSEEEQKIYDEMRQMLTPATMPDHPKWTRSNVTEEEAKQLNRIVAGINLDFDEEYFFHELKSTYQNGVFTVQSERTITAAPAEQVDKENEEGYRFACEKADAIIAAMPPILTRYGKYLYLAKAVCDMVQYDDSHPTYITYRIRGAFEDGKTICTGYTDAYAFLCHRAGLYCISIGGNGHAWNGIRLNNELYHFDTTWMDSGCNGTYNYLFAQPFTSDEYGHADSMMDFFEGLLWFPGWSDMILSTGSINWEKELEAPAII